MYCSGSESTPPIYTYDGSCGTPSDLIPCSSLCCGLGIGFSLCLRNASRATQTETKAHRVGSSTYRLKCCATGAPPKWGTRAYQVRLSQFCWDCTVASFSQSLSSSSLSSMFLLEPRLGSWWSATRFCCPSNHPNHQTALRAPGSSQPHDPQKHATKIRKTYI